MKSYERLKFYQEIILEKVPLLLSLQDRERYSPTYGCFDRTFWQWKFIDFPCARFQEVLLILSYLYSTKFDGNTYYQNSQLLEWIEAGFLFWAKIQHRDGSFDEAYPFERSFVATGFTLFYLTEAFFLVGKYLSEDKKERIINAFRRAGDWLIKNDETHAFISNHRLGTCGGLYNLAKILIDDRYKRRCWEIWKSVRANQSRDGWFNEYGGADPGYLTQGIYYGSLLYERSKNKEIFNALEENLNFIKYFIHPDGTIGGEYGSRNTEFYFPGGFELLAKYNPIAESICRKMAISMKRRNVPSVYSVDIYNMIPILNSIASSCIFFAPNSNTRLLPYEMQEFVKNFEDFKIYVRKLKDFYIIIGLTKGGIVKVFDSKKQGLLYSAVGIFGKVKNKVVTSQAFHRENIDIKQDENEIVIEAPLVFVSHSVLSPTKMIMFRWLSILMKFSKLVSKIIKRFIVKFLVFRQSKSKGKFRRIISFKGDQGVKVFTEVIGLEGCEFQEEDIYTSYHMGSSRYFKMGDLKEVRYGTDKRNK